MHGILQYRHIRHIPSIGLHGQNRQKESALPKIGTALLRIITLFLFLKFDGLSARFFVRILAPVSLNFRRRTFHFAAAQFQNF